MWIGWIASALLASVYIKPHEIADKIKYIGIDSMKQSVISYLPVRKEIEFKEVIKEVVKEVVVEIPVIHQEFIEVEVPRNETNLELTKIILNNIAAELLVMCKYLVYNHLAILFGLSVITTAVVGLYIRGRPIWFRLKKAAKFVIYGVDEVRSRVHENDRNKQPKKWKSCTRNKRFCPNYYKLGNNHERSREQAKKAQQTRSWRLQRKHADFKILPIVRDLSKRVRQTVLAR
jgi:hypothetical protein